MNDDRKGADVSEDVAIAHIVTAVIIVFYAVVFAISYYLPIKVNRETLREIWRAIWVMIRPVRPVAPKITTFTPVTLFFVKR